MNNSTVTTKISAAFLATVLVAGIIALSSPSFMTGAQAQEYYGMDRDNKKSDKKDVSVKSVKCNNVNVNVNGLELNLSSVPFLSGLLTSEADEGERGAGSYGSNGYGNGGSYGDKSRSDGDFKFICINNNNNTVIGVDDGETPIPPPPPPDTITCEECFEENLTPEQLAGLNSFLEGRQPVAVDGFDIEIAVNDLAAYCTLISLASTEESLSETVRSILFALNERVLPPEDAIPEPIIEEIIQCVLEALANEV
jgi:hypothetical protein